MAEEAAAAETALKIIDWEEAMTQVGGDEEFLNEVLQDLLTGEWDGCNYDLVGNGWNERFVWLSSFVPFFSFFLFFLFSNT